jgi:outer membrane receptor protein involved in Fe transport
MRRPLSLFLCLCACLALSTGATAQIRIGTVTGTVVDPAGGSLSFASVVMESPMTGFSRTTATDTQGAFTFHNVPFDRYIVRIKAPGFQDLEESVRVASNIPVVLRLELKLPGTITTVIVEGLLEQDSASTQTRIDQSSLERLPGVQLTAGLQQAVATMAGWSTEDNGLLHARGVDDGFLYVMDGIPLSDRLDTLFAGTIDREAIQSMQVINGHIPVEYGYAFGGIISISPKSGIDTPFTVSSALGLGSFRSGDVGYTLGGNVKRKVGFFFANALSGSSRRYLDPIDPQNFNNRGGAARLHLRTDWQPSATDLFLINVALDGSDFRVTNTEEQEQAGQRQRQQLRDNGESITWQRVWSGDTVTNVGWYRRSLQAELLPSDQDTPLWATQFREHVRSGLLVNWTRFVRGHTLKAGADGQRVTPRESFSFYVTDPEEAEEADLSEGALEFDEQNPFEFRGRVVRGQASGYLQDTFSPYRNLTVNVGVRFDHTALLVSRSLVSPRLGAVYYFPQTKTTIRGSYNRLFKAPQVENLLLSSSEEARRLSPFATPAGGGGAEVPPETQHAFEVGFGQDIANLFRLDAAYWWRLVRNYADPNVFFATTIIFPNAVAEGKAQGLDLRIDFPLKKGWTGYASYSNSRVFQVGPVNGGLFLEEDILEIGSGTKFNPDHDQRNVGSFGIVYHHKSGVWASLSGRHESGTPLEVEQDELDELMERHGAELVNFERQRVKSRTLFDLSLGKDFRPSDRLTISAQCDVRNLFDRAFAYNFGNPFSGTHFGHPRMWSGGIKFTFR